MHEKAKLAEARHFPEGMYAERGNPPAFTRELSAFMAAARSVLQYALSEARLKPGGQQWYDQAMGAPLLRFFTHKRDISIHQEPVSPVRKMTTKAAGLLNIGDDDDEIMIPYSHSQSVEQYQFQDWPGENVLDVSRRYLIALEGLVVDGVANGWITG